MEVALCHPSGTYNCVVASRFLEKLCTPVLIPVSAVMLATIFI
jgi:hypothetical protein